MNPTGMIRRDFALTAVCAAAALTSCLSMFAPAGCHTVQRSQPVAPAETGRAAASSDPPVGVTATPSGLKPAQIVAPSASAPAAPPPCDDYSAGAAARVEREPGGARKTFSWDGYHARSLARPGGGCVAVLWPGPSATTPRAPEVAAAIDDAWLRLIANTLARLPAAHAARVLRVVIDDRPTEHGIAPFDRKDPADARDGRTLWLHHRLFTEPNHWARGNFGSYWSYHVQRDGVVVDGSAHDHDLFSPVLLHEIGHLVAYTLTHVDAGEATPPCAVMCGDRGDCARLSPSERERGCVSPYCMPFKVAVGTENWAEQYRLYFQGAAARDALEASGAGCLSVLRELTRGDAPPWAHGPDGGAYRRSRWESCGGRACKAH